MALITLPVGINIIAWTGPATTLIGQPWFTGTNLSAVYQQNGARSIYLAATPGDQFALLTQVTPSAAGAINNAYIINVKTAFQLDDSLLGVIPNVTQLVASFPAATTNLVVPVRIPAALGGTYGVDPANPSVGLTNLSYSRAGVALSLPAVFAAGDLLLVTGTTVAGTEGAITFIKQ